MYTSKMLSILALWRQCYSGLPYLGLWGGPPRACRSRLRLVVLDPSAPSLFFPLLPASPAAGRGGAGRAPRRVPPASPPLGVQPSPSAA